MKVFDRLLVFLHRPQRAIEKSSLPQSPELSTCRVDLPRGAHLQRFHDEGYALWISRPEDRMPRRGGVRKKHPGGQKKSVLLSPRLDDPRQDFEIILVQHGPRPQKIAGHEEIPVRAHQAPQAPHTERVLAVSIIGNPQEPQSYKTTLRYLLLKPSTG